MVIEEALSLAPAQCAVGQSYAHGRKKQYRGGLHMDTGKIFQGLASLNRWVPYKLSYNTKREKFDKIPAKDERYNLSTGEPKDWSNLPDAMGFVNEVYGLSGVGFVTTGGVEVNGWTLVGFDFDDVTADFVPPLKTYAEKSPSKKGVRMFAWAPTKWTKEHQDTLDCKPKDCDHCEVYIGTAPRFLTVTFDTIRSEEIARLSDKDLRTIESWGMHKFEDKPAAPPAPDLEAGTAFDWARLSLTPDERHLVNGTGDIDHSNILYGLIIKAFDAGRADEDILASMVAPGPIWQVCLNHRNNNEDKALQYAKDQIKKAYPKSKPGQREALIGYSEKWKPTVATAPKHYGPPLFPMELFDKAPGLVGDIARWIMQASHAPREEFAYAVALSTMACLIGPYCTVGGGILNLYIALVGGTGTGKTEAMKAGLGLLSEIDAKDCVADFPASEAAMRRQLNVTPNVLIRVDELAHKFESFKGDSSNGSGLSRAILEAFDGDRMPPKPYADEKKSLPAVDNPFVQILGGTTTKIWEVLQTKHLEDGTLNRFVFVSLPDDPQYSSNHKTDTTVPKALKDKLNAFFRAGRMSDLIGDVHGFGRCITFSPEVKAALEALGPVMFDRKQEEYGELYSRFEQYVSKIAAILAVGDGREVVGMTEYQQALAFMTWSVGGTLYRVSGSLASSDFERKTKRIARKLSKTKGNKMSMRDLYRFMTCSRKEMEALVEVMVLSGMAVKGDDDWVSLLD